VTKRTKPPAQSDAALKVRFGAIVRSYRQQLELSQEELAWRADMHRTYLADIERGRRNISLSRIVRLVRALEKPMAEFFFVLEEYFQSPVETAPARVRRSPSAKSPDPAAAKTHRLRLPTRSGKPAAAARPRRAGA
jgi:transcriptional regulator with XRE-family HTH domain